MKEVITVIMKDGSINKFNTNPSDSIAEINSELNIEFGDEWLRWE